MVKKLIIPLLFLLFLPMTLALDPWYNLTNFTDNDNLVGILKVANDYTFGVFGIVIYVGFFIVMLFLFSGYTTKEAFAGATFITAIVGIVLLPLNIINPWLILLAIFGAVGSFVSLFY